MSNTQVSILVLGFVIAGFVLGYGTRNVEVANSCDLTFVYPNGNKINKHLNGSVTINLHDGSRVE